MSWVNIIIPSYSDKLSLQEIEINRLKSDMEIIQRRLDYCLSSLENIPKAINEFGYIELYYENTKLTLIEKK